MFEEAIEAYLQYESALRVGWERGERGIDN
jgi:hypothetical protein